MSGRAGLVLRGPTIGTPLFSLLVLLI
jgi:hypothetical protein